MIWRTVGQKSSNCSASVLRESWSASTGSERSLAQKATVLVTGLPSDQVFDGVTVAVQRPFARFSVHTVFAGAAATEQEPLTLLVPDVPRSAYVVGFPAATKVAVTDLEALLVDHVTVGVGAAVYCAEQGTGWVPRSGQRSSSASRRVP